MSPEVGTALRGKSLIQVTTTTKDEVDELVEWTDDYDIQILKGGIMVYPDDIRACNGAILYGGSKNLFGRLHPLHVAMGESPSMFVNLQPMWLPPSAPVILFYPQH